MDIGYTSGGPKILAGLQKMYCLNGYRVYLRGTQNMNRFAKDVLPKWIHIGVYLRDLKYEWYAKDVMPEMDWGFFTKNLRQFSVSSSTFFVAFETGSLVLILLKYVTLICTNIFDQGLK